MKLFGREIRNRQVEDTEEFLISTMPNFMGNSGSFVSAKAIENSDIFSGINRMASDIASLNLDYFKHEVEQADNHLSYLFNVRPNDFYNGYQLKFILVANILLNGESFVEIVKGNSGQIQALYHVKNSEITYKQDQSTKYDLVYEITSGNKVRRVSKDNILHLRFFSLDGITGISPLRALKEDIDTQRNSKRFLGNFFKNNTQAGGMLTVKGAPLSKEAKENLKNSWQEENAGTDNAHKVLILDETMEYEPIEIDVEILKLINTSNFTSEQIAKVLKIPPHMFGLGTTNLNLEELGDSYIIHTLNPYLKAITAEINYKLGSKTTSYQFGIDDFKFINVETKTQVTKDKISYGLMSINEGRKEFGMKAIDDEMFDKHFINLNHTTLDTIEMFQLSKMKHNPIPNQDEESSQGGDS